MVVSRPDEAILRELGRDVASPPPVYRRCDDSAPAEDAWQELHDTTSGAVYFYNASTGESRWDDPRAAAGWTRAADASGREFYYNQTTGASSWDRPSEMGAEAAETPAPSTTHAAPAVTQATGGASSTTRAAAAACAKRRSECKAASPEDKRIDSDDEGEADGGGALAPEGVTLFTDEEAAALPEIARMGVEGSVMEEGYLERRMDKRSTRVFGEVWERRYVLLFGQQGSGGVFGMYKSKEEFDAGAQPIKNRVLDPQRMSLDESASSLSFTLTTLDAASRTFTFRATDARAKVIWTTALRKLVSDVRRPASTSSAGATAGARGGEDTPAPRIRRSEHDDEGEDDAGEAHEYVSNAEAAVLTELVKDCSGKAGADGAAPSAAPPQQISQQGWLSRKMENRSTRIFGDSWATRYVLLFGNPAGGRGVLAMYKSLADLEAGLPPIKNRLIDVRSLRLVEQIPGKEQELVFSLVSADSDDSSKRFTFRASDIASKLTWIRALRQLAAASDTDSAAANFAIDLSRQREKLNKVVRAR